METAIQTVGLTRVNDRIWVHTSLSDYRGAHVASNGLVALSSEGLVLIDTPWNDSQMRELAGITKEKFGKDIRLAVITHAHVDRLGGINELIKSGINVISTPLTAVLAARQGFRRPSPGIHPDVARFHVGNLTFETFYPGEGHTADNIVVWFPACRVLFGGCLIKSGDSRDVCNAADSNILQWPDSMRRVLNRYPRARVVIPGHGKPGGQSLIRHTIELLENK